MPAEIVAAGGVLYRPGATGPEFLLVHRPRYDDWSLPKGKLDPGEKLLEAAEREVAEETGYEPLTERELGTVGYETPSGRTKMVRYWLMHPQGGHFAANHEVDAATWLTVKRARNLLSYGRDREVLRFAARTMEDRTFGRAFLIRHALAFDRDGWNGGERSRHISAGGRRQARGILELLSAYPVTRVLTSDFTRCRESVAPLADRLDLDAEPHPLLGEGAGTAGFGGLIGDMAGESAVMCSHGNEIEAVLDAAAASGARLDGPHRAAKGGTWMLEVRDGAITAGRYRAARSIP
jgi:8-oxo-dGTP diphosphatase